MAEAGSNRTGNVALIAWYAIRTEPSAQRPHATMTTKSNVEVSLIRAGFHHYMPAERRSLFHHRTKKTIVKRAALLPGYIFVADVVNWLDLFDVSGVGAVLGIAGTPVAIPHHQIENLKKVEQAINEEWTRRAERLRMKRRIRRKWGHFRSQLTILKSASIVRRESEVVP